VLTRAGHGAVRIAGVLLVAAGALAGVPAAASGSSGQPRDYFIYGIAGVFLGFPERNVLQMHGLGRADRVERPTRRCYQLKLKSAFLTVTFDAREPGRPVTGLLATSEPNCPDAARSEAEIELVGCGEIRLGDPLEKLQELGAEPQPAGTRPPLWPDAPAEVTQYDYRCGAELERRVQASAFVRAHHVIGISVRAQSRAPAATAVSGSERRAASTASKARGSRISRESHETLVAMTLGDSGPGEGAVERTRGEGR
jgi:hypothetical protein